MAGIADTLGLQGDDAKVFNIVEDGVKVIGGISGIVGAPTAVLGILTNLGLFKKSDATLDAINAINSRIDALFSELSAEDQALLLRDVAKIHDTARAQELVIRDDLRPGDPNFEQQRGQVLNDSLVAVTQLGDIDFYKRPFFSEEFHRDAWSGELKPPGFPGTKLAFEYRLTLPAFVHCIQIRLTILAVLFPGFASDANDRADLADIARNLEELYRKIVEEALFELRRPTKEEALRGLDVVGSDQDAHVVRSQSAWDGIGRLFGAVDSVSGIAIIESYPDDALTNNLVDNVMAEDGSLGPNGGIEASYKQFSLVHQLRTLRRKKILYRQTGLPDVWRLLQEVKQLARLDSGPASDFGGFWFLRELNGIVASSLFDKRSLSEVAADGRVTAGFLTHILRGTGQSISLRAAVTSAMGEALS